MLQSGTTADRLHVLRGDVLLLAKDKAERNWLLDAERGVCAGDIRVSVLSRWIIGIYLHNLRWNDVSMWAERGCVCARDERKAASGNREGNI